jgi:hypothetical protein
VTPVPVHRRPIRSRLVVELELEEFPVVRLVADSDQDAARLTRWLERPLVRIRLVEAIHDAIDAVAEGRVP